MTLQKFLRLPEATEVPLFLSETKLDQDGYPMSYINIVFDFSWVPLANGQRNPEWHFASNETVLFRAVSASVEPAYFLSITPMDDMDTKIPIVVVTRDGFPVTSIEEVDSVTIDAGSRSDLLVKFDVEPGTYLLRRAPWNLGITGVGPCLAAFMANVSNCISYDREETFATIVVEETPVNPPRSYPPQEVPPLSPSLIALLDREVDGGSKTVVLKQKLGFPIFQIPFDDGPTSGISDWFWHQRIALQPPLFTRICRARHLRRVASCCRPSWHWPYIPHSRTPICGFQP